MSFLSELMAKKAKLKPTITLETYADGSQKRIDCAKGVCVETIDQTMSTSSFGFVVDTKPDLVAACVLPDFLYLGSQDAVNERNIELYGITDIMSVGIESPPIHGNNLRLHHLPCLDLPETNLRTVIDAAMIIFRSVRERQPSGRILVHCNAGVSRSSTICIAYLMLHERQPFQAAYDHIKQMRECIRPNDGFLKQLRALDSVLF